MGVKSKKGYHFTEKKYLKSIMKTGLMPRADKKKDDSPAVFYSENKAGAIAMYANFIEREKENSYDGAMNGWSNADKVYLQINLDGVEEDFEYKQANFANRCTKNEIPPEKLSVMYIRNAENNELEFSADKVIDYFASETPKEEIFKAGVNDKLENTISELYEKNKEQIDEYRKGKYLIEKMQIKDYLKLEQKKEKNILEPKKAYKEIPEEIIDKKENRDVNRKIKKLKKEEIVKENKEKNKKEVKVR